MTELISEIKLLDIEDEVKLAGSLLVVAQDILKGVQTLSIGITRVLVGSDDLARELDGEAAHKKISSLMESAKKSGSILNFIEGLPADDLKNFGDMSARAINAIMLDEQVMGTKLAIQSIIEAERALKAACSELKKSQSLLEAVAEVPGELEVTAESMSSVLDEVSEILCKNCDRNGERVGESYGEC